MALFREKRKDVKPFFLIEEDLCMWEHNLKEGILFRSGARPQGKTEFLGGLGIKTFDKIVALSAEDASYRVIGSAATYKGSIIRISDGGYIGNKEEVKGTPQKSIVYSGMLAIYSRQPSPDVHNYTLLNSGEIWIARPDTENYFGENGLFNSLFEGAKTETKRVEEILAGLENLAARESSERFKREHSQYRSGKAHGRAEAY